MVNSTAVNTAEGTRCSLSTVHVCCTAAAEPTQSSFRCVYLSWLQAAGNKTHTDAVQDGQLLLKAS